MTEETQEEWFRRQAELERQGAEMVRGWVNKLRSSGDAHLAEEAENLAETFDSRAREAITRADLMKQDKEDGE